MALIILAVIVIAGSVWAAVALPPVCPSGFHANGAVCLSDRTHIAPSSGVRIPVAVTDFDPRSALRIAMALGGVVVASGLVVLARPREGWKNFLAV